MRSASFSALCLSSDCSESTSACCLSRSISAGLIFSCACSASVVLRRCSSCSCRLSVCVRRFCQSACCLSISSIRLEAVWSCWARCAISAFASLRAAFAVLAASALASASAVRLCISALASNCARLCCRSCCAVWRRFSISSALFAAASALIMAFSDALSASLKAVSAFLCCCLAVSKRIFASSHSAVFSSACVFSALKCCCAASFSVLSADRRCFCLIRSASADEGCNLTRPSHLYTCPCGVTSICPALSLSCAAAAISSVSTTLTPLIACSRP